MLLCGILRRPNACGTSWKISWHAILFTAVRKANTCLRHGVSTGCICMEQQIGRHTDKCKVSLASGKIGSPRDCIKDLQRPPEVCSLGLARGGGSGSLKDQARVCQDRRTHQPSSAALLSQCHSEGSQSGLCGPQAWVAAGEAAITSTLTEGMPA